MENCRLFLEVSRSKYNLHTHHVEPTEHGMMNHTFIMHSTCGLFVLKHYAPGSLKLSDIRRGCEMQLFLHARGLPVPELLLTPDKSPIIEMPGDGGFITLTHYVEGQHYERGAIPTDAAYYMGIVLGQIQAALVDFPHPVSVYTRKSLEKAIRIAEQLLACAAKRQDNPVDRIAYQRLLFQRECIERLAGSSGELNLHVQWTHGDFQETNVLFDEGLGVATVVDFDGARAQPRGLELMRALSYSFPVKTQWDDAADAFLRGYFRIVRPSEEEVAHYSAQWAYHKACSFWPIESRYLNPHHYQSRWDKFIAPPSGWWETHVDEVTHRLMKALADAATDS